MDKPPSDATGGSPAGAGPGPSYRLGLPAWAFPAWRGRYFPTHLTPLDGYARVFNAVEGNTTFYRIPDPDTVRAWLAAVRGTDFRFCFKLPREITHEGAKDPQLLGAFLQAIEPLGDHLGPLLLQFPAWVGPDELAGFDALFKRLSADHQHVLELRHPAFFSEPEILDETLHRHRLGRVVLDSRPLYEGDRSHPEVLEALHEKPDLPVRAVVYNDLSFTRLILHPDRVSNGPYLHEWAERSAAHLAEGVQSWVMIHCPNNGHCPELALRFHRILQACVAAPGLPDLPPWPVPQQAALL